MKGCHIIAIFKNDTNFSERRLMSTFNSKVKMNAPKCFVDNYAKCYRNGSPLLQQKFHIKSIGISAL